MQRSLITFKAENWHSGHSMPGQSSHQFGFSMHFSFQVRSR